MEHILTSVLSWLASLTWMEAIEAFFVGMSMIGQHFIAKRDSRGFYFWILSNVVALVMFASLQRWMTCFLYLYYTYKSLEGIRNWKSLESKSTPDLLQTSNAHT